MLNAMTVDEVVECLKHCGEAMERREDCAECRKIPAALAALEGMRLVAVPENRPKIVCLCGSGRFREAYERAEFDRTLQGEIVLTIGCNSHDVARTGDLAHHKPMLDELHLRKIDLADEVFILNVGGYVGESTTREIAYAQSLGKPIKWLEDQHAFRPTTRNAAKEKS